MLKWVGVGGACLSSLFSFTAHDSPLRKTLYVLFCITMGAAASLMVIALVKIRKGLVNHGMREQISPLRMVVHALAFLIYILSYIGLGLTHYFSGNNSEDYFSWFVDTIMGFLAYLCLFFVIWHLGAKSEDEESSRSSGSTIVEPED